MKYHNSKAAPFVVVILATVSILLNGCGPPPDTDITSSPEYNFSSFAGTTWRTKVKTAFMDIQLYTGNHVVCLFPPDTSDPNDPNYRPVPGEKMVSVLPIGTRVQFEKLMKDNGIGSQLWLIAAVENGTNVQTNVYVAKDFLENNEILSIGPSSSTNWEVNPKMLEPATNAH
jgi:hypothetical protein